MVVCFCVRFCNKFGRICLLRKPAATLFVCKMAPLGAIANEVMENDVVTEFVFLSLRQTSAQVFRGSSSSTALEVELALASPPC